MCVLHLIHSSNNPRGSFSTLFPIRLTYYSKDYLTNFIRSAKYQQTLYACIGTTGNKDDFLNLGSASLLQDEPRRVAAVSTAKRVAYEMGCGSGQSIPSNNLISYQTRYETAGLGTSTQIKFMTDGILLQEIQSDLLLRKYGAIIIDEESPR